MSLLVVVGERTRVEGWALAGALVLPARTAEELRQAWAAIRTRDVAAVLLTPAAARGLAAELDVEGRPVPGRPVVAVLPS